MPSPSALAAPAPPARSAGLRASRPARSAPALGAVRKKSGTVDHNGRESRRLLARAMRMAGAEVLRDHPTLARRAVGLSACGQTLRADAGGAALVLDRSTGAAAFSGVLRCGAVWTCPECSARVSAVRKAELDHLLSWARSEGLSPVLLTLTARHGAGDALAPLLRSLGRARQRLAQRREWRALGVVGTVTALEVTHGRNGFHPHYHVIALVRSGEAAAVAGFSALLPAWLRCLEAFGLSGSGAALQAQGAAQAGAYVAKAWAAASEMTLTTAKRGRDGGRSPWEVLEVVATAESPRERGRAARVWLEYAEAFHGKRQLTWSRGLKAACGLLDVPDDEAAEAESEPGEPSRVVLRVWTDREAWRHARRRIVALLRAAESGGDLDAAEFGPADCERWRARPPDAVLEAAA